MKYSEFKEAKSHGTPGFPVEFYYVCEGASNYVMPLHWHEELEIVRVLRGNLLLFINNEPRTLREGDVAFVGSGMLHRAEPLSCDYECLVFSPSFLKKYSFGRLSELLAPLITGESHISSKSEEDEEVKSKISSLFSAFRVRDEYIELRISAEIADLLYTLYTGGRVIFDGKNSAAKHQTRTMIKLIDWIEEHYAEHISLEDMARISGLSPKYLCGFFKRMTGATPTDYVNRLRIEKACLSLEDKQNSITDAAFDNGFNELSYFSKLFKKYVGCTPREYRAKKE